MVGTTSGEKFHRDGDDLDDNILLNNKDQEDKYYIDLWKACAGPRVYVPLRSEKVFYFPQGHAEQVQSYCSNQDDSANFPAYNLPSEILCKAATCSLKAEDGLDEVYSQITLLSINEQKDEACSSKKVDPVSVLPPKRKVFFFSKTLTPSDTSTHGGFSVPKRYADECFPRLDMSLQPPVQEIVAKDLNGFNWTFRHIYRGQPKRHLLTSGWSMFVSAKKLVPGDACIFVRGENGELRVGIRRAMNRQSTNNSAPSVVSGYCMQHGIFASAYHAMNSGSMFVVFHRPWRSPHFVVSYNRYMESTAVEYSSGMKFSYIFVGEDFSEKRVTGTIASVEDHDPIRWPNSKWKCLKVQWDSDSNVSLLPERLSPWEIKLLCTNLPNGLVQLQQPFKRGRDIRLPEFQTMGMEGLLLNPVKRVPHRRKEVLQGQEINNNASLLPQTNPLLRTEIRFPIYPSPEIESTVTAGLSNRWSSLPSNGASSYSVTTQESVEQTNTTTDDEATQRQFNSQEKCMLFGVNLFKVDSELPSRQGQVFFSSSSSVRLTPKSNIAEKLKGKQCYPISNNRSCTKVLKYGTALGRSVDLNNFGGYEELISELDKMFEFKGSLEDGSSGWKVTYMDEEGDLMLVGDYEWQAFRVVAQKLFICPKEELNRMMPELVKSGLFAVDG